MHTPSPNLPCGACDIMKDERTCVSKTDQSNSIFHPPPPKKKGWKRAWEVRGEEGGRGGGAEDGHESKK